MAPIALCAPTDRQMDWSTQICYLTALLKLHSRGKKVICCCDELVVCFSSFLLLFHDIPWTSFWVFPAYVYEIKLTIKSGKIKGKSQQELGTLMERNQGLLKCWTNNPSPSRGRCSLPSVCSLCSPGLVLGLQSEQGLECELPPRETSLLFPPGKGAISVALVLAISPFHSLIFAEKKFLDKASA